MAMPNWLRPVAVTAAALVAALLLAGVVYRSVRSPGGYDHPRLTWNTKNTTRFAGADASAVAVRSARRSILLPSRPTRLMS